MTEIVYDAEGNAFELRTQRQPGSTGMFGGGSSLRSALGRVASARSVADDPTNRDALARALVGLGACSAGEAHGLSLDEVRGRARRAFETGALGLHPHVRDLRPLCDVFELPTEDLADEAPPAQEMQATHTLELAMVDDDDQPVANEAYRVELPDGMVIEGQLDAQGRALLTGIEDAGNCTVTFPRLDEAAWA